jgi:hypothetical protein
MKKILLPLLSLFLLSACALALGGQPTPPPLSAPTVANTPTIAPTFTPTVPSPTFTVTPTMIGLTTKTAIPDFLSPTPPVLTKPGTADPEASSTPLVLVPLVKMTGFISISTSGEVFYMGSECQPVSVRFTAQVSNPVSVAFVVLFVRFKSKQTGATSEWTSIGMAPATMPGFFIHDLVPLEMKSVKYFENTWVQYQLVATDANSSEVGRTDIFDEKLSLLNCVPTPTPSPSVTPTVLVP